MLMAAKMMATSDTQKEMEFTGSTAWNIAPSTTTPEMALVTLISGVCSFEEAAKWLPGVEQKRDNPALSQVFYRKEMYIEEEF